MPAVAPTRRVRASGVVWLAALLSITVAARGAGGAADGKIDEGLDNARQVNAVFVRMADQLIGGRGE